nr:23S ribosomal RNA methyltransferase Erm [Mycolicibacterium malmesburyense]CRL78498.1 ribosomal RNA adenine dimethylase [Mycolicibacterium malmesburyense]
MSSHFRGRHEHGQNFLRDRAVIAAIVDAVARTEGPIVEIGPGAGALTLPLQRLKRPLTAVEIDPRQAARLEARTSARTRVVTADFLRYRLPRTPHVVVGNLPFHLTTAILRRILHNPAWTDALLLVQWEVARRRAGIGGATMMTAQWWPWFDFRVLQRVPATAFAPKPSVDGGLMTIARRAVPLVDTTQRRPYQAMVRRVFTGRGRSVKQLVRSELPNAAARRWLRDNGIRTGALPRDLTLEDWVTLYELREREVVLEESRKTRTQAHVRRG